MSYGAFIVPGLIMLTVITQAISNASFGIYFPKFIGTIYELLSAPINFLEIVIGYVGAAATKALFIGIVILGTSFFFVDISIQHPLAMLAFLVLTCISFALMGFIIGIWAGNFEQLQLVPLLIVTPLVFLGGSFYSISMLPPVWQTISMFNPVVYLVSGFRWAFFGLSDVPILASLAAIALFHGPVPGGDLVDLPDRLAHSAMIALVPVFPSRVNAFGTRQPPVDVISPYVASKPCLPVGRDLHRTS